MTRPLYIALLGTLVLLSCLPRRNSPATPAEPLGAGCLAEIKPAIIVEIRDARTGVPLAQLARGVVQDRAYGDSLIPAGWESQDPTTMYARRAANERPGTYEVRLERPGYHRWQAHRIRVHAGQCGVQTVRLQARLRPL